MTNTIDLFSYLLSLKPVTKTLEGISMAYKRLIIKNVFSYTMFCSIDSQ